MVEKRRRKKNKKRKKKKKDEKEKKKIKLTRSIASKKITEHGESVAHVLAIRDAYHFKPIHILLARIALARCAPLVAIGIDKWLIGRRVSSSSCHNVCPCRGRIRECVFRPEWNKIMILPFVSWTKKEKKNDLRLSCIAYINYRSTTWFISFLRHRWETFE